MQTKPTIRWYSIYNISSALVPSVSISGMSRFLNCKGLQFCLVHLCIHGWPVHYLKFRTFDCLLNESLDLWITSSLFLCTMWGLKWVISYFSLFRGAYFCLPLNTCITVSGCTNASWWTNPAIPIHLTWAKCVTSSSVTSYRTKTLLYFPVLGNAILCSLGRVLCLQ